jgi:hypothetical protein
MAAPQSWLIIRVHNFDLKCMMGAISTTDDVKQICLPGYFFNNMAQHITIRTLARRAVWDFKNV